MNSKKPKRKSSILALVLILVICVVIVGALTVNILSLTRLQKANDYLTAQNEELSEKADKVREEFDEYRMREETDYTFDYLAIGNSITRHPVYGGYWWGDWGMAATAEETDYYHRVKEKISQLYPDNVCQALNFTVWEDPFYERRNALCYLEGYLNEKLDVVSIQLGENIQRSEEITDDEFRLLMDADYRELLAFIRQKAPNAKLIVVGNFWEDEIVDSVKQSLAQEFGASYISLAEIRGAEYRIGMGAEVLGADGVTHVIEAEGVGEHPNDEAMRFIAERIAEAIPGLSN